LAPRTTVTSARRAAAAEHVDVADDQRPARDDPERIRRVAEDFDARAREPVAALRRLVRASVAAPDHDAVALPHDAREPRRKHRGDVRLDADAEPYASPDGRSARCSNART
jgi:hypothetical protein